jgi:hypothetical protein
MAPVKPITPPNDTSSKNAENTLSLPTDKNLVQSATQTPKPGVIPNFSFQLDRLLTPNTPFFAKPPIRAEALHALVQTYDPQYDVAKKYAHLIRALDDPDKKLRLEACHSVKELGGYYGMKGLLLATKNKNGEVRQLAYSLLLDWMIEKPDETRELGGEKLEQTLTLWRKDNDPWIAEQIREIYRLPKDKRYEKLRPLIYTNSVRALACLLDHLSPDSLPARGYLYLKWELERRYSKTDEIITQDGRKARVNKYVLSFDRDKLLPLLKKNLHSSMGAKDLAVELLSKSGDKRALDILVNLTPHDLDLSLYVGIFSLDLEGLKNYFQQELEKAGYKNIEMGLYPAIIFSRPSWALEVLTPYFEKIGTLSAKNLAETLDILGLIRDPGAKKYAYRFMSHPDEMVRHRAFEAWLRLEFHREIDMYLDLTANMDMMAALLKQLMTEAKQAGLPIDTYLERKTPAEKNLILADLLKRGQSFKRLSELDQERILKWLLDTDLSPTVRIELLQGASQSSIPYIAFIAGKHLERITGVEKIQTTQEIKPERAIVVLLDNEKGDFGIKASAIDWAGTNYFKSFFEFHYQKVYFIVGNHNQRVRFFDAISKATERYEQVDVAVIKHTNVGKGQFAKVYRISSTFVKEEGDNSKYADDVIVTISFSSGIKFGDLKLILNDQQLSRLRLLYSTGCYDGNELNAQEALNAGFKSYVGHPREAANWMVTKYFFRNWALGLPIDRALGKSNEHVFEIGEKSVHWGWLTSLPPSFTHDQAMQYRYGAFMVYFGQNLCFRPGCVAPPRIRLSPPRPHDFW